MRSTTVQITSPASIGKYTAILYKIILFFGCAAFLTAALGWAYTGTFSRLWADDYCYDAVLRIDGFWKAQASYYDHTSDRFSVIPLVGIGRLLGPYDVRIWPTISMVLFLGGLTWLIKQLTKIFKRPFSLLECSLGASILLFFTLWQAPNLFQILYWRTGMLTYFLPLAVSTFLFGLIFWAARREQPSVLLLSAIGLLSFFAGGFSETVTVVQLSLLCLFIVTAWFYRRKEPHYLRLLVPALLGTLAAVVILFLSPSNKLRWGMMAGPASLPELFSLSFRFGYDFIVDTIRSQPLPTFLNFLIPAALGAAFMGSQPEVKPISNRGLVILLGSICFFTYLLVVAVCAPTVYVEVAYPEGRVLIAARFVMTTALAASGWLLGTWVVGTARRIGLKPSLIGVVSILFAGILFFYPLRATRTILSQSQYMQRRAAEWDVRDKEIRTLISQGESNITVESYDNIFGLVELQTEPDKWPNTCMRAAYGLQSITGYIK